MGRIAEQVRSILPVTWSALVDDDRIGSSVLTARVNYAEELIFGEVLTDPEEDSLNGLVVEYAGKKGACEIIDTAIDFWMVKSETQTTTGTNEVTSYPDRIKALRDKKKDLLIEIAKLEPIVADLIPNILDRRSGSAPLLSTMDQELLTSNPQDFGPAYAPPEAAK